MSWLWGVGWWVFLFLFFWFFFFFIVDPVNSNYLLQFVVLLLLAVVALWLIALHLPQGVAVAAAAAVSQLVQTICHLLCHVTNGWLHFCTGDWCVWCVCGLIFIRFSWKSYFIDSPSSQSVSVPVCVCLCHIVYHFLWQFTCKSIAGSFFFSFFERPEPRGPDPEIRN